MATRPIAPEAGQFHTAISEYKVATGLRHRGMSDDEIAIVDSKIDPLFEMICTLPARSPTQLLAKAETILSEYGELDTIPTRMFRSLVSDLRRGLQ